MVKKQSAYSIKRLVSNNGGEYIEGTLQAILRVEGIVMDRTESYIPQQNPVSKRGNQTMTGKIDAFFLITFCQATCGLRLL